MKSSTAMLKKLDGEKFKIRQEKQSNNEYNTLIKNNSFFEDDPNFLYEYMNREADNLDKIVQYKEKDIKLQMKRDLESNKKPISKLNKQHSLENIDQNREFILPDHNDNYKDYVKKVENYLKVRKKHKNDEFLQRLDSERENIVNLDKKVHKQGKPEDESKNVQRRNENIHEFVLFENDQNLHKNHKETEIGVKDFLDSNQRKLLEGERYNKKRIDIYSIKEIKDFSKMKRNKNPDVDSLLDKDIVLDADNYKIKKEEIYDDDNSILNKMISETTLVNNNTIIYRPSIHKSKKQQHYEQTQNINDKDNKNMMIMTNKSKFKNLDDNEIKYRLNNFEKKIMSIQNIKYKEKLNKLENVNLNDLSDIEEKNKDEDDEPEDIDEANYSNEFPDTKKEIKKKGICEKLLNFFIGDPTKTYAYKKHKWCGDSRYYGKKFEDTRDFGEEEENKTIK